MILLNNGRLVVVPDEVILRIRHFTVPPEGSLEAGGILLGSYRGPHIEIIQCTSPLPKDQRAPFRFYRRDPGHDIAARTAWKRSKRTVTFVGEWHTHPEDDPKPSEVDRNTWFKLMQRQRREPMIFLIAGRTALRCDLGIDESLSRLEVVAGSFSANSCTERS